MIDYGRIRNTVRPQSKEIDDFSVWINTNIEEITVEIDGETHVEFEFNQVQYSKDEYITVLDEKNSSLETQATDIQLALCDVYEMLS